MMGNFIIGLDIGTSKISAVACNAGDMAQAAVRSVANDADMDCNEAGGHQQDPARIIRLSLDLLREIIADRVINGDISAIGISGQMHGVVLAGHGLEPLTPLYSWRDQRISPRFGEALTKAGSDHHNRCGAFLGAGYGAVTLNRLAETSEFPAGSTALTIADLVAGHLTGLAATGATNAAGWGLYNLRGRCWDEQTVGAMGIPPGILPRLSNDQPLLGSVKPSICGYIGVVAGVPVAVPIGDNQASVIGAVGLDADTAVVNIGTGAQISIPCRGSDVLSGLETRPMPFGGFIKVGASLCGGWAYAYLKEFFKEVVTGLSGRSIGDAELYAAMNRLAASSGSGAGKIKADTRFAGTRTNPAVRGSFSSLDTGNMTVANMARS
ncbi:MAG: FGGY family carbohydrate kinase, partial [Myxococcota bacterium]